MGAGRPALIYLGRYRYRGVIREKDILACDNGQVRLRYSNANTGGFEHRTMPGTDFLWLILQHVLPKGFRRARNFGFLHPNCKRLITLLHLLLRFQSRARDRVGQSARADLVCVLWRNDDDRANADSTNALATGHHAGHHAHSHLGDMLIV